jgi:TRAP-type C4-dicarboxylate transport system permease small subunit
VFNFLQQGITAVEKWICAAGLLISTLLTFAQVINRYWLHFEIMWIGDMALYVFVITYILAIALAASLKGHIAVEMLPDRLFRDNPHGKRSYSLAMDVLTLAAILVFLHPAYGFFRQSLRYPEYGTLIRWFNTGWLVQVMFATVVLSALHVAYHIGRDVFELRKQLWLKSQEGGNQ